MLIAVITNADCKRRLVEKTVGATLLAPQFVHWEVGHALSAMIKVKRISLAQGREALAAYRDIQVRFLDVDLDDALILAEQLGLYAHGGYIIAVARVQRCPLLSLNRDLLNAARRAGLEVIEGDS